MKQILLTLGAFICLSIAILSAGVIACFGIPQITENLTRATALVDQAHFTRDQLVDVACKTRAFVAGELDRYNMYSEIKKINVDAKTQYSDTEEIDFAAIPNDYSLDSESLAHLEDVASVFANIRIAFGICSFLAILFLVLLFVFCGKSAFGRTLFWTGLIILFGLLAFVIWSIADFNSMFNTMHSLFFAEGSWLFDEKSLLITMYPTAFWVCMAAICVIISSLLSFASLIIGKIVK